MVNYNNIRERLVQNMKNQFLKKYNLQNLVVHMYDIFKNLNGVGQEN